MATFMGMGNMELPHLTPGFGGCAPMCPRTARHGSDEKAARRRFVFQAAVSAVITINIAEELHRSYDRTTTTQR